MNTLYEKAVELLVSGIQDKVFKEKISALGKKAEMEINELLKTTSSIPSTRRERRKLERKKK